ncbi:NUDIX hydrolase domain-like protein [Gautieria morchelliformis]|nr:NUDIX hydrolase domain-like protein [Gautieria morchelliformis]
MASSGLPTTQLFSPNFVLTAGAVLFRRSPAHGLQVCILHQLTKDHWLLPKGRKDRGESIEAAALRETFEETGYPCRFISGLRMWTRAPPAGSDVKDVVALATNSTEPFAVTMRTVRPGNMKFTFWYIAEPTGTPKQEGTQTQSESFASEFFDVEIALRRLTFASDREVVEKALSIVTSSDKTDDTRCSDAAPP